MTTQQNDEVSQTVWAIVEQGMKFSHDMTNRLIDDGMEAQDRLRALRIAIQEFADYGMDSRRESDRLLGLLDVIERMPHEKLKSRLEANMMRHWDPDAGPVFYYGTRKGF